MRILPHFSWRTLDRGEAYFLDLDPTIEWEVLEFEWLNFGIMLFAQPARTQ